jgi:ActR/RegA family two-component response regulator
VNSERFICSLKVVDPTLHTKGSYANVVIYASKFEDLPIVHRLGDIIRVHRANMRIYQNKRQFNVNMFYQSSYALFSTDKQTPLGQTIAPDAPYAFSGKRATIERQDNAILGTLRKWASNLFQSTNVGGDRATELKKASKSQGDFDVVAKVLQVFELDEYTNELKLRDLSGETFFTLALKLKFPHIRQGSVVRIRSATYDETSSKRVLVLQHYSNIMTFISSSKLAAQLSKVNNENQTERAALKTAVSMTPVILTEVDKKHQNLQTTSLHDLFHNPDSSTNTFRTCFYVTKVEPGNVNEAVKSYDRKTRKSVSAKGSKGGDLIYQVQFLAKDVSTQFNNNVYRVLLYTHEGLGANFFAQKPANLYADSKAASRVQESFSLLTRFNSWVDCVVERRNGYYFIKDTKMIF